MARKNGNGSKLEPAVRYLRYRLTTSATPGTETSHYIDLARDLSTVNRRLYKQGRNYHVKKISVVSTNTISGVAQGLTPGSSITVDAGMISASTCPDTWVSHGAWHRGKQTWDKMNKVATDQSAGNIAGTWSDFKVHLSLDMKNATLLNPVDNGNNLYQDGEWVYSQMVTPDGTATADEFELTMLGDHDGSAGTRNTVGLIKSYGESRPTVSATGSPAVPGDADDDPLINIFDYGTTIDDVVENLEFNNDYPPYDPANYPGADGNGPKPAVVQHTSISDGRATLGGFSAFCGLVELEVFSSNASDLFSVLVELAPGKYRGIKAESI